MKRFLIIIQGILMAFAAFVVEAFLFLIITNIYGIVTGAPGLTREADYYLSVIAIMISSVLFYFWYKHNMGHMEKGNLKVLFSVKTLFLYLMLGIGCQFFISGLLSVLRPVFEELFAYYDETINSIMDADPVVVAIYVVLVAPVSEELMIRGILFNKVRNVLPFLGANLLQAAVFGIYHWDIIQGIYAFGTGLLLGYIYYKSRTLLAPILLHMLINATGLFMDQIPPIPHLYLISIAGGGAFLAFALYRLVRMFHESNA